MSANGDEVMIARSRGSGPPSTKWERVGRNNELGERAHEDIEIDTGSLLDVRATSRSFRSWAPATRRIKI